MGCDIHFFTEIQVDGTWLAVRKKHPLYDQSRNLSAFRRLISCWAYTERDMTLFAYLADVHNRDRKLPAFAPRGLPPDASPHIHQAWATMKQVVHHESWLSLDELMRIPANELQDPSAYLRMLSQLKTLAEENPSSVRAVFWFDN